jgi:hypothetical protein
MTQKEGLYRCVFNNNDISMFKILTARLFALTNYFQLPESYLAASVAASTLERLDISHDRDFTLLPARQILAW